MDKVFRNVNNTKKKIEYFWFIFITVNLHHTNTYAIEKIGKLNDSNYYFDKQQQGLENAKKYSWDKTAKAVQDFYNKVEVENEKLLHR